MSVHAKQMTEEQLVMILRNALVVAGQEMGDDGDHWPVIKDSVHKIMKTWENVKTERNIDAEMKTHLYLQLEIMESGLPDCTVAVRASLEPKLKELRDVYDAYFDSTDTKAIYTDDVENPAYLERAKAIIATLGEDNE